MLNTREFEDAVQGTQVKSKNLSDVKHQRVRGHGTRNTSQEQEPLQC